MWAKLARLPHSDAFGLISGQRWPDLAAESALFDAAGPKFRAPIPPSSARRASDVVIRLHRDMVPVAPMFVKSRALEGRLRPIAWCPPPGVGPLRQNPPPAPSRGRRPGSERGLVARRRRGAPPVDSPDAAAAARADGHGLVSARGVGPQPRCPPNLRKIARCLLRAGGPPPGQSVDPRRVARHRPLHLGRVVCVPAAPQWRPSGAPAAPQGRLTGAA